MHLPSSCLTNGRTMLRVLLSNCRKTSFFLEYCSCKEHRGVCKHSLKKCKSVRQSSHPKLPIRCSQPRQAALKGRDSVQEWLPTRTSSATGLRIWICSYVMVANSSWICSIALGINTFGSMWCMSHSRGSLLLLIYRILLLFQLCNWKDEML